MCGKNWTALLFNIFPEVLRVCPMFSPPKGERRKREKICAKYFLQRFAPNAQNVQGKIPWALQTVQIFPALFKNRPDFDPIVHFNCFPPCVLFPPPQQRGNRERPHGVIIFGDCWRGKGKVGKGVIPKRDTKSPNWKHLIQSLWCNCNQIDCCKWMHFKALLFFK